VIAGWPNGPAAPSAWPSSLIITLLNRSLRTAVSVAGKRRHNARLPLTPYGSGRHQLIAVTAIRVAVRFAKAGIGQGRTQSTLSAVSIKASTKATALETMVAETAVAHCDPVASETGVARRDPVASETGVVRLDPEVSETGVARRDPEASETGAAKAVTSAAKTADMASPA
jgi:hypothetical protein